MCETVSVQAEVASTTALSRMREAWTVVPSVVAFLGGDVYQKISCPL